MTGLHGRATFAYILGNSLLTFPISTRLERNPMSKPISPSMHMKTDYMLGPLVAAAPDIFDFKEEKLASFLCRMIGGGVVVATSLTNAKGAILPVVPLTMHLAGDVAGGLFALGAPFLFGFKNPRARNTFLGLAAVTILAGTLTRTTEKP